MNKAAHSGCSQGASRLEEVASGYNTLDHLSRYLSDRCLGCLMYRSLNASAKHELGDCNYCGGWGLVKILLLTGESWDLYRRTDFQSPVTIGVCFKSARLGFLHVGGRVMVNCVGDQVGQLCWIVFTNLMWRAELNDSSKYVQYHCEYSNRWRLVQ